MKLAFTLLTTAALFGSTLALPAEIIKDNINAKWGTSDSNSMSSLLTEFRRDQIQFEICINKNEDLCQVLNLGIGDCRMSFHSRNECFPKC